MSDIRDRRRMPADEPVLEKTPRLTNMIEVDKDKVQL